MSRKYLKAGCILVLALLVGFSVGYWKHAPEAKPSTPSESDRPPQGTANHTGEPGAEAAKPRAVAPAPVATPTPQVAAYTFLDYDSRRPVAGLEVFFTDPDAETPGTDRAMFTSDAAGRVFPPPLGETWTINLQTSGWRFHKPGLEVLDDPPNRSMSGRSRGDRSREICVQRVQHLHISFRYADGRSYSGFAQFKMDTRLPVTRRVEDHVAAWHAGAGSKLSVAADSARVGFASARVDLEVTESAEQSFEIILPASDTGEGIIELDLGRFDAGTPVVWGIKRVTADDVEETAYVGLPCTQLDTVSSGPLTRGTYRVYAYQASTIENGHEKHGLQWKSDLVQLHELDIVRLTAAPKRGSGVRAKIVSETGEPLCPAILRSKSESYVSWPSELARAPGAAAGNSKEPRFTDKQGDVVCLGLWPGSVDIQAEAPGYEVRVVSVEVVPGQTLDVGTITLCRARGSIDIVVIGDSATDEAEYELILLQPRGVALNEPVRFKGTRFRINDLPLRTYTVCLNDTSEQTGASSQNIDLTVEVASRQVTFQMRAAK